MATATGDDKDQHQKETDEEEEEKFIWQIRDELGKEITDPIKESTVEYYNENKDKVRHIGIISSVIKIYCNNNIMNFISI